MLSKPKGTLRDRQNKSFVESPLRGENFTAQEVISSIDNGSRALIIGKDYDVIDATYPTPTTEVYTYSLQGVQVQKLRVTYLTSSKDDISRVEVI